MAKINSGGATAAGMSGIVEHGAPIVVTDSLSELDPELNLDGTLIKGDHPDHAKEQKRNVATLGATDPVPQPVDEPADENTDKTPEAEQKEQTSPGGSSKAFSKKTANTSHSTDNRR